MNFNQIPTQSKQWLARRQARTNHTYLSCRFQLLTLSPLWRPRKFYLIRPFQRSAISTVRPFPGSIPPIPTPASLPQVSHTLAIHSTQSWCEQCSFSHEREYMRHTANHKKLSAPHPLQFRKVFTPAPLDSCSIPPIVHSNT